MEIAQLVAEGLEKGFIVSEGEGYVWNPSSALSKSLGFEEVALLQGKNKCKSRLEPNLRSEFIRGMYLDVPLIASNMSTVVNVEMCRLLDKAGALGVMHRAWRSEDDYIKAVRQLSANEHGFDNTKPEACTIVAASVGVGDSQVYLAERLYDAGATLLVIDIAHGYSDAVKETAVAIKKCCPFVKLIVGNTINVDMLREFDDVADGVKVGIAQGLACETKNTAGCTERQFSAVFKFKEEASRLGMPIISDGGIREPGDFTKAIAAGANSVMAGSTFARCPESAAEVVEGKKIYAGMASRYVQERWKGGLKPGTCPEGKIVPLDIGEPVDKLLERYAGALRSGITYAGATDIQSFQEKVTFIRT